MFVRTDFWPPRLTTCKFSSGRIVKSPKGFLCNQADAQTGALVVFRSVTFHFTNTAKICQLLNTNLKEDSAFSAWRSRNLCAVPMLTSPEPREGSENDVWCILIPVCAELSSSICIEQYWMAEEGHACRHFLVLNSTQLMTVWAVRRVLVFSSTSKQMRILQFSCFSPVTAWLEWSEDRSSHRMVSRRKILSRSRDDLNIEAPPPEEEEDIWYNRDKLYKVSQTAIILVNNWRNHEWHWHGTTHSQSHIRGGLWSFSELTDWVLTNPKIIPCDATLGLFVLHCARGILTRSQLSVGIQWFIPRGRIPSLVSRWCWCPCLKLWSFSGCKMSKYSPP